MTERVKIAEERLAKSRRISASQQQTTERLLKKTGDKLKEAKYGNNLS